MGWRRISESEIDIFMLALDNFRSSPLDDDTRQGASNIRSKKRDFIRLSYGKYRRQQTAQFAF